MVSWYVAYVFIIIIIIIITIIIIIIIIVPFWDPRIYDRAKGAVLTKIAFCIAEHAVSWAIAIPGGRSPIRFPMASLEFFIDIILPAPLWPWVRLSL